MNNQLRISMLVLAVSAVALLSIATLPAADNTVEILAPGGKIVAIKHSVPAEIRSGERYLIHIDDASAQNLSRNLSEAGIELKAIQGRDAFWVTINRETGLTRLPSGITVVKPRAADKISSGIRRHDDGTVEVVVTYFNDVSFSRAKNIAQSLGADLGEESFLLGNRLRLTMRQDQLNRLAAADDVMMIEPSFGRKSVDNDIARQRSNVDEARDAYDLTGSGIQLGIIDGGIVYASHTDFGGRVIEGEDDSVSSHATHVAGTMIAAANDINNSKSQGMAYESTLVSYSYNDDELTKMQTLMDQYGAVAINNSWGYVLGWSYSNTDRRWEWNGDYFGMYYGESANIDDLVYSGGKSVIFSAGNDRDEVGPTDGHYWEYQGGTYVERQVDPSEQPKRDGPYNCTGVYNAAKNCIAVGSTDYLDGIAGSSSWGPTEDGRLKPEICAKGVSTYSTESGNNYSVKSGTSMASPVVTGSIALLQQHYINTFGRLARPEEIKGVICLTAKDLGNGGPDYSYGFGLLDVYSAATLISDARTYGTITRNVISSTTSSKYYKFTNTGSIKTIRVMLIWTDPPFTPVYDKTASVLVNDLDVKLIWFKERKKRTIVKEYYPFVLDPDNPEKTASKGVNVLDNVELIEKTKPKKGDWYIEISATRLNSLYPKQNFALLLYTDAPIDGKLKKVRQPKALK